MHFKKYLIAGLLVWLPLAITVWVLTWLYGVLDGVFAGLLSAVDVILPNSQNSWITLFNHYHGLGVALMFGLLLATGAFVSNVAGRWMVRQWDRLFTHIPFVKSIYNSVKKVSHTLFSDGGNAFRKALLVQFPRQGCWTIAFQTGTPAREIADLLDGEHLIRDAMAAGLRLDVVMATHERWSQLPDLRAALGALPTPLAPANSA